MSTVTTKARQRKRENNEAESNEGRGRGTYILIGYSKDNEAESNEGRRYESFPFASCTVVLHPIGAPRRAHTHDAHTHTQGGYHRPPIDFSKKSHKKSTRE